MPDFWIIHITSQLAQVFVCVFHEQSGTVIKQENFHGISYKIHWKLRWAVSIHFDAQHKNVLIHRYCLGKIIDVSAQYVDTSKKYKQKNNVVRCQSSRLIKGLSSFFVLFTNTAFKKSVTNMNIENNIDIDVQIKLFLSIQLLTFHFFEYCKVKKYMIYRLNESIFLILWRICIDTLIHRPPLIGTTLRPKFQNGVADSKLNKLIIFQLRSSNFLNPVISSEVVCKPLLSCWYATGMNSYTKKLKIIKNFGLAERNFLAFIINPVSSLSIISKISVKKVL